MGVKIADGFMGGNPHAFHSAVSLEQARATFKRWLGDDYDTDAVDAMLAAAAVERLDGDPVWLLIISGSGNAKTETVQALSGINATVVSTITSEGALLSATSKRERTKDATGGLLREIGDRGVLVIKDVTSILSMNRDLRGQILGAFREIHDGSWVRKVGTDGGRSLPWSGRIAVIGAVTTAWDQAHAVIASMGDRFVLVRVDSTNGRVAAGRKAIGNTGVEAQMRAELAGAVAGVIAGMETTGTTLTEEETDIVLAAADLVTLARTGVEYDYRGDVIDAHAPEMPTRFAKELTQIIRGAVAIGIPRHEALRLAIRCARDSMPPLRLTLIDDLAANPGSSAIDVRKRINKPRSTVDRQLQALHMLGVLDVSEEDAEYGGKPVTRWFYTIAAGIEPGAIVPNSLEKCPEKSVPTLDPLKRESRTAIHPLPLLTFLVRASTQATAVHHFHQMHHMHRIQGTVHRMMTMTFARPARNPSLIQARRARHPDSTPTRERHHDNHHPRLPQGNRLGLKRRSPLERQTSGMHPLRPTRAPSR